MTIFNQIKRMVENELDKGNSKFIIFPFGDVGYQVRSVLEYVYDIKPEYILDNKLCMYNKKIKSLEFLKEINCDEYTLILATDNKVLYEKIIGDVLNYFDDTSVLSFEEVFIKEKPKIINGTKVGKYSYGHLCDHWLVEEVGAFTSIASSDVVPNHAIDYISTSGFIYVGSEYDKVHKPYKDYKEKKWYFDGVEPKGKAKNLNKIKIGNDVWLGSNVIITNGANIGNGAIVGAGAIVTKDVPDYAVVVGVPARIIRYRYEPDEIEALNKIKWWDWTDEKIRECYDDFFLPIKEFIEKHL